jgi:hypothetical protein
LKPAPTKINFNQKLALFEEQWSPKVIAEMNDYQFKLVRLQGEFVWHQHEDTDETFIVLEGELTIDLESGHTPPPKPKCCWWNLRVSSIPVMRILSSQHLRMFGFKT